MVLAGVRISLMGWSASSSVVQAMTYSSSLTESSSAAWSAISGGFLTLSCCGSNCRFSFDGVRGWNDLLWMMVGGMAGSLKIVSIKVK